MEHSVQAYIQRQSTDFLMLFVKQCLCGKYENDYDYLIPYILRVLMKRDDFHKLAVESLYADQKQKH